jgi:hypothetical protein
MNKTKSKPKNAPQQETGGDCPSAPCSPSVVTCVYCGHEYPDGTPTAKHDLLTAHIKVCEKHPMREAEARIERLRKALTGLIGAETKEELEAMEAAMRMMPGIEADKIAGINAIHALLSEVNDEMRDAKGETKL